MALLRINGKYYFCVPPSRSGLYAPLQHLGISGATRSIHSCSGGAFGVFVRGSAAKFINWNSHHPAWNTAVFLDETSQSCCLTAVLNDSLVYAFIVFCRSVPREVLCHAALHHPGPLILVAEDFKCALYCVQQRPRTVAPEFEAVATTKRLLVNGVVEAASRANYWNGAVFQAINLIQATRLIT